MAPCFYLFPLFSLLRRWKTTSNKQKTKKQMTCPGAAGAPLWQSEALRLGSKKIGTNNGVSGVAQKKRKMKEPLPPSLPRHLLPLPLNLKPLCPPFFFFSFLFSKMRIPTIHPSIQQANWGSCQCAAANLITVRLCEISGERVKDAPTGDQRVVAEHRAAVGEGGEA